jgi:C1A family cysteine protease
LVALAAISAVYVENSTEVDAFGQWKTQFGTNFEAGEEAYRRLIFQRNLKKIEAHNTDSTQTYQLGITQFSIYTEEEFKLRFLSEMIIPANAQLSDDLEPYPTAAVDWTTQGKVSRVKNQGQCGSCWSFSATGVAESWALFSGKSWDLSEQQLVDCSASYGNHGCQGGWPSSALKYVKDHGLTIESSYPYVAKTNSCVKQGGEFKISNVLSVSGCTGLATGITARPLSITVDATNWSQYKSGIFNNCAGNINHAVLLVGTDATGVWKVKNSWGTSWGESGFIRLKEGNTCGVCSYGGVYVS